MTRLSIRFVFPLLFLFIAGLAVYALISPASGERHIGFSGSFVLVDQEQLFEKVERLSGENVSTEDFVSAVSNVLGKESYIESHSIRLSWPNSVVINIEEIDPIAILNGDSLFTRTCGSFKYESNILQEGMLNIETKLDARDPYLCGRIQDIASSLHAAGIGRIEVLNNGNYGLEIAGVNYLISGEAMQADMARLKAISDRLSITGRQVKSVDLRYTSGGAVKLL